MITAVPIKNEKDIAVPGKTVLVLGYFDGIHRGIKLLKWPAGLDEGLSASCRDDLYKSPNTPNLPATWAHAPYCVSRNVGTGWSGMGWGFLLDFNSKFASLTGQEFALILISRLRPAIIVAGFDYTFGSDKKTVDEWRTILMEKSSLFLRSGMKGAGIGFYGFVSYSWWRCQESSICSAHQLPISWNGRSWKCSWSVLSVIQQHWSSEIEPICQQMGYM